MSADFGLGFQLDWDLWYAEAALEKLEPRPHLSPFPANLLIGRVGTSSSECPHPGEPNEPTKENGDIGACPHSDRPSYRMRSFASIPWTPFVPSTS